MNPEWKFLLDTMIRWIPYIAVLIFIPIAVLLGRCMSKRACRNGPILRSASFTDEEFWTGDPKALNYKKQQSQLNSKTEPSLSLSLSTKTKNPQSLQLHTIRDNCSDILRSVSLTRDSSGVASFEGLNEIEFDQAAIKGICLMCSTVYTEKNVANNLPCACVNINFHQKCADDWYNQHDYCSQCLKPSKVALIK